MSSYVSGGKTWSIPKENSSNATTPTKTQTIKATAGHYGYPGVMLTLGFILAINFSMIPLVLMQPASPASDYSEYITKSGGFIMELPSFTDLWSFAPLSIASFIITPLVATVVLRQMYDRNMFTGPTNKKRKTLAIIATTVIFLSVASLSVGTRTGIKESISENAQMEKLDVWMNDRYGFQPLADISPKDVENGKILHPDSLNFPVQDVKFVKVNDGFHLYDVTTDKELPIKSETSSGEH